MKNFIIENWGIIIVVVTAIVVFLYLRIRCLERFLANANNLKSRAEFETKEAKLRVYLQDRVIVELLKKMSDEDLVVFINEAICRTLKISDVEVLEREALRRIDVYRLCEHYASGEIMRRKEILK